MTTTASVVIDTTGVAKPFPDGLLKHGVAVWPSPSNLHDIYVCTGGTGMGPGGLRLPAQPIAGPGQPAVKVRLHPEDLGTLWAWGSAGDGVIYETP